MNGLNESEKVLVQKSSWRIGFYLIAIGAALMFLLEAVELVFALQMALLSNQVYLGIHIANSYFAITMGTILIGVWTALLVAFTCTHLKSTPKDIERLLYRLVGVYLVLSWIWFIRTMLFAYWDYSTSPPTFPIYEALLHLPLNIYSSAAMIAIIIVLSVYTWHRWLRPSTWDI